MGYHEKRNDEKPLSQISNLKNKFIRKVKEIFNNTAKLFINYFKK